MTTLCLEDSVPYLCYTQMLTHSSKETDSAVDAHRHTGTPCLPQVLSLLLFWDAQWCFVVRVLSVLCPTVTALSFLLESVFLEFITALVCTSMLFLSCLIFLGTCLPLNFDSALKISSQSVRMCQKFYHFKLIFERENDLVPAWKLLAIYRPTPPPTSSEISLSLCLWGRGTLRINLLLLASI